MSNLVLVQIVGAPVACAEGTKDSWREVAHWVEDQLSGRFGEAVQVNYYSLFDADCPTMPNAAQLPLVLVNGEVTINGGKISIPAIRRKIEKMMETEIA